MQIVKLFFLSSFLAIVQATRHIIQIRSQTLTRAGMEMLVYIREKITNICCESNR